MQDLKYETTRKKIRGEMFLSIGMGWGTLDKIPKIQRTKAKLDKLYYIKLKASVQQKTISRVKRQPIEWEKMFANCASDKGLIS
jgi:hypothetical protein